MMHLVVFETFKLVQHFLEMSVQLSLSTYYLAFVRLPAVIKNMKFYVINVWYKSSSLSISLDSNTCQNGSNENLCFSCYVTVEIETLP